MQDIEAGVLEIPVFGPSGIMIAEGGNVFQRMRSEPYAPIGPDDRFKVRCLGTDYQ